MSDYYDKNKFSGRQQGPGTPPRPSAPPPPRRPAPPPPTAGQRSAGAKKDSNEWWHSWPVIVILFAANLWPVALGLLIYNIIQDDKRQKQRNQAAAASWNAAASQAESAVQEAMRKAQERAREQERRQTPQTAEEYIAPVRPAGTNPEAQAVSTGNPVRTVPQGNAQSAAKPKAGKPKKFKTPISSKLMRLFGVCLFFIGGIAMSEALPDLLRYGSLYLEDVFASLGFLVCGGALFWRGRYVAQMTRRSQRYILAIGTADTMSLEEIAKRVNRTPAKAEKELQKLIDKGYLGEDAYIDHERGYFLRFGATLEDEREEAPAPVVPEQTEEGYSGILRNIRRANDRIADEELSRKIDRLEQISGLIFREVEAHPEKRERIHTFFDYYLPTTQKLLDAYAEFEATGVEGENLRQAKERIEQTMDTIVGGFEHQLDQLYSTDAMDVVSDIKVMEAMMNRDTASAAKDFGYAEHKEQPQAGDKPQEGDNPDGGIRLQI